MLQDYKKRRDFKRTPEPTVDRKPGGEGPLTFVVQKHAARQLHYDFRLELDGVLKSWAVSKGPSYNPKKKRLAVMVEDHPLNYASFEGNIPRGEYGAGEVIVWDRGTYSPDENGELSFDSRKKAEELMREGLESGKLSIFLRGKKLKGSWTLVRMKTSDKNWLLIKHKDKHATAQGDILSEEISVISGVTIDDIKSGRLPPRKEPASTGQGNIIGAVKADFPSKILPMLASPVARPFSDEQWLFEPKLDGFRTLAFLNDGEVWLQSRRGINVTKHYPALSESIKHQPASQLILDGEIIALDFKGKICFQCLQGYLKSINRVKIDQAEPPSDIIYYIFDILFLDGYELRKVPLKQRKELLHSVLDTTDDVRLVEHFLYDGEAVYRAAIENGLEGAVAKKLNSLYEPEKRSDKWLKIKAVTSEEFVVGGFTGGTGNRSKTFGALLLGYYDEEKNLQYAGNVGSGFNNETLLYLRKLLETLSVKKSPFHTGPEETPNVTWVEPKLVAEVKYAEFTRDGRLRAPVFLRTRDDKAATSIHRVKVVEKAGNSPETASEDKPELGKDILEQLDSSKNNLIIEVEGQKVSLSNLNKALWPETSECRELTKRDLIRYLAQVSPWLLPHLEDRPLTLSRYPNGIYGQHFFQKHYQQVPGFVDTVPLSSHDSQRHKYLLCNNLATLLWLGQIGDIELHSWFSRVKSGPDFKGAGNTDEQADYYANYPDFIIFDIDPYIYSGKEKVGDEPELNRSAFSKTCRIALNIKETLDNISFPSFVKTSGRTGLHIFIPIVRQVDFHATHSASETLSRFLMQQHPNDITIDWSVEKRTGKVFLDYNQNARGKTLASVYSPRPSSEASVSVPLRWDELDKVYPSDFTILTTPDRLTKTGDLWANIMEARIDLVNLLSEIKTLK